MRSPVFALMVAWLLALALASGVQAQTQTQAQVQAPAEGLRAALLSAEGLVEDVQAPRRLLALRTLRPTPGSPEALEHLFLIASTKDAPPPSLADWDAWLKQAGPAQRPLWELVRSLADAINELRVHHYREAATLFPLPAPAELEKLPAVWRLRALLVRATAVEETGDPQAALLLRLEARKLLELLGPPWRQALELMSLSVTYSRVGQLDRGLYTAQEAVQRAKGLSDDAVQARVHNGLSLALSRLGRDADSRRELETALMHGRRSQDQRLISTLLGNLSDVYLRAKEPARALRMADEAYALGVKLDSSGSQSLALHNRGIAKIRLGRINEGKADVRQSITLELQRGAAVYAADGLEELGRSLEEVGDLPGAMQAFSEYRELADAQTRQDRREALRKAQAEADHAQQERESQLLAQQSALNAETLRAQRLRAGLAALAVASGAALLVLLYLLYRRLRRTNALLAATNRNLAAQSEVDPLTGLGNRRRLQRLLRQHEVGARLQAALLIIDIDHFKQINDRYGHAGGDIVLQAVASRLLSALREGEGEGVVRWGGEEFLLLLPEADLPLLEALTQRLLKDIGGSPISLRDGRSLRVTVSMGCARFPLAPGNALFAGERAVDIVDALMYQAKSHGRNQAWLLQACKAKHSSELQGWLAELELAQARGDVQLQRISGPLKGLP